MSKKEGFMIINGVPVVISPEQIKAASDYDLYARLVDPTRGELSQHERKWVLDQCIKYLSCLEAIVDCYSEYVTHGNCHGKRSPVEWEDWLRSLTEDDLDAEFRRVCAAIETEIVPWQEQERARKRGQHVR